MNQSKVRQSVIEEIKLGLEDEPKLLSKYRRASRLFTFVPAILLGTTLAAHDELGLTIIPTSIIAAVLGFLMGLAVLYRSAQNQWPVLKELIDHKKVIDTSKQSGT